MFWVLRKAPWGGLGKNIAQSDTEHAQSITEERQQNSVPLMLFSVFLSGPLLIS